MDYQEFEKELMSRIEEMFENSDVEVTPHIVMKTNETIQGMEFYQEGFEAAPVIYPKDYYQDFQGGESIDVIAARMAEIAIDLINQGPELPEINDQFVRDHLRLVVMNLDRNKEYLEDTPYETIDDIAVVPKVFIDPEISFLMNKYALENFHLTDQEALGIAHYNMEQMNYQFCTLKEAVGLGEPGPDDYKLYMLTNEYSHEGAAAIVSRKAMTMARNEIGEDFLILPCSRHEVILVPRSEEISLEALEKLVRGANENVVEPKDWLSDHVYRYRGEDHSIKMVESKQKPPAKHLDPNIIR